MGIFIKGGRNETEGISKGFILGDLILLGVREIIKTGSLYYSVTGLAWVFIVIFCFGPVQWLGLVPIRLLYFVLDRVRFLKKNLVRYLPRIDL
ncbi:hypothetical protein COT44_03650 [Candidatus Shapirobacteria bacterium CG08_land_8_20_14_0_20_39_18]|uniref:Uncharacterized protein n=1 Tax=Candidatus Shapirobacteria bacterium CG08_land_8_20_14_0_20_39_18 TaxID=1974883 RepID=A0A2M6XC93_9BACT|nr:MAG: hypothetical protein COT44_03650 [Candidatus Shapirobacteria bacterium CG08_land_8_20_14_0_20_39_18]